MSKARSLNKVMLIGNLTRSPVLRETGAGVLVCSFGIATNTSWKDSNGVIKERAEYHNLIAFNKLAEICAQVLNTGMLVWIEGELRTRVKEDPNGNRYYRTEVKLNDMILIDSKNKRGIGIEEAKQTGKKLPSPSENITEGVQIEDHPKESDATDFKSDNTGESDTSDFKSEDLF